jgi:hypothetical protein
MELQIPTPLVNTGSDGLPPTLRNNREGWGTLGRVIPTTARLQNPGVNVYPRDTPKRVARGELNS